MDLLLKEICEVLQKTVDANNGISTGVGNTRLLFLKDEIEKRFGHGWIPSRQIVRTEIESDQYKLPSMRGSD